MPSTREHPSPTAKRSGPDFARLARAIKEWGRELGFQQVGIAGIELAADERRLLDWLARERHGEMHYMRRHGLKRSRPERLRPGTVCVISTRVDYWPRDAVEAENTLADPRLGYISRYALGRDYHKVIRRRLQRRASARRLSRSRRPRSPVPTRQTPRSDPASRP